MTTTTTKNDPYLKQFLPFNEKVKIKANTLRYAVGWDPSRTEEMYNMLFEALKDNCPYCGQMMSITDITLDHKAPLLRSKLTAKFIRKTQEFKELNKPENLHFICSKCNGIKREIPHDEFLKLMEFLNRPENYKLKSNILKRLSSSGIAYSFARYKRRDRLQNG